MAIMTKPTTKPPQQQPPDDDGTDEMWGDLFWSYAGKPSDKVSDEARHEPAAEAKPAGKPKKLARLRRAR
jgi:hypothetical protein